MNSIYLGVNIDHVATLRQARGTTYPDPLEAALIAEASGADGITLHLREDRRHIQDGDVEQIKNKIKIPMNLECAVTDEMIEIAQRIRPAKICLVPEKRTEITTEGGLDVIKNFDKIREACQKLTKSNSEVSLFIAADIEQIKAAKEVGAPVIEIHTGAYANAKDEEMIQEYRHIVNAVEYADNLGLLVNAGHGLHYTNTPLIAKIPAIHELNIGHAIVARAIFVGFKQAVQEMKALIIKARHN